MSLIVRASSSSARSALARRGVRHSSGHGTPDILPFNHKNKKTFKYKYFAFVTTSFTLPLAAVGWQLRKSAGSA